MNSIELEKSLKELIKDKIPTFIWGSPGIGKSSIVKEVAKELGLEFIDLRLSLLDPTDLKGIPFFDNSSKEAIWALPNFLPKDKNSKGVLFLDEINTAPPSVQAAAYQLILDRKIGEYELPKGWAIVAAGNNLLDMGATFHMPSPLANRFVHIDLEVDFNAWKRWAYKKDINPLIVAYLQYDNSKLFVFEPQVDNKAFATPRSWEYVNKILNLNLDEELKYNLFRGAIGDEVASSFFSFLKVAKELVDLNLILEGKEVEIKEDANTLFIVVAGLINRAKDATKKELENIIKFSLKLPAEFSIMLIKDLEQIGINLYELEEFEKWVEEFGYLLED